MWQFHHTAKIREISEFGFSKHKRRSKLEWLLMQLSLSTSPPAFDYVNTTISHSQRSCLSFYLRQSFSASIRVTTNKAVTREVLKGALLLPRRLTYDRFLFCLGFPNRGPRQTIFTRFYWKEKGPGRRVERTVGKRVVVGGRKLVDFTFAKVQSVVWKSNGFQASDVEWRRRRTGPAPPPPPHPLPLSPAHSRFANACS